MIVLQTILLGVAMTLALYFFGYGITRLLLPRAIKGFELLLMPFFGMALVIVWDYSALWLGFDLAVATWALVVVGIVVMVVALMK
ncbi:MAG: hypothetical protein IT331_22065, partial [Anaerolineae bacterium]|nr:hypothetical protein [Anaerolineae bacterium]